jgi:hypothetical protein
VLPIVHTPSINADVRLDARMAKMVSPALMPPATDAPLYLRLVARSRRGFMSSITSLRRTGASAWRAVCLPRR